MFFNLRSASSIVFMLCLSITLLACGKKEEAAKKSPSPTLISIIAASSTQLEIREEAVGSLEGLIDPTIAAEIPASVVKILVSPGRIVKKGDVLVLLDATDANIQRQEARAEVARLEALLANQDKVLERNKALVQKNFISQNALDDIATQKTALKQQLAGAQARLANLDYSGGKARVVSPIDGVVEKQIVSTGDYVKVGDPLLQLIGTQRLRAHLPFPESVAAKIQPGLKVRLTTPTSETQVISSVREMKPMVGANSRAIDVTADVIDQAGWQPGASVNGTIILGEHAEAIIVPEQSVVLRPAGEVVYVIADNIAHQRIVKTGFHQEGNIEILEGLAAGEIVAVDGAAFLTDAAKVAVQDRSATTGKP
ncbi:efflux transporter periplasmic adaptor subunit [Methylovorus sp. MM2]|uniref:efflux RND transporter periplasmic adaptor subunit n=1 Tax=Methylovorus sp. MM2 TaxID=1848038 RepID=UPI0007DF09E4|nr:efflux RND transporter periplasmic adaptor subunit [Methylovorus sp. MM2]OAM51764.1 efflux transporter periplasmic adaptor subunit [Methylovorus sp. MM2]